MHSQHDLGGEFPVQAEEHFEHLDHKIHWGVVIVKHHHLIHGWRLQGRLGLLHRQAGGVVLMMLRTVLIEC
ncbi:hypothetical protein D3C72_2266190 [compost metagenome]